MNLTLTPAYGRDYASKKAVLEAWNANQDFVIASMGPDMGRYINRQDAVQGGIKSVHIRYKRLTQVAVVKVSP